MRAKPGDRQTHETARKPFRFEIAHPDHPHRALVCGWDPRSGYFIEVVSRGTCVFVCLLANADQRVTVRHVLGWMIEQGYFAVEDVKDAICALETRALVQLPARLRGLALLIVRLRGALEASAMVDASHSTRSGSSSDFGNA